MKHYLAAPDRETIAQLLTDARRYKDNPLLDKALGQGLRVGMLFLNPSLRTRISTQIAAQNLGMESIVVNMGQDGWRIETEEGAVMNGSGVEHIKDAAGVLGSYFDIICLRSFPTLTDPISDEADTLLNALIRYSGKPVISLESTRLHPLQSLADWMTIRENADASRKPKVVLSWAPHVKPIPHCVAHSFAQWMQVLSNEVDFVITHPPGYELSQEYSGNTPVIYDQQAAIRNADFIYVKNWCSYRPYAGMPEVQDNWLLSEADLLAANARYIMHCLPVRRNVELKDELLDGNRSLVQQQAANRVWAAQSVIANILKSSS